MPDNQDIHNRPAREVVDDLMEQSETALRSTARATAELRDLTHRVDEALDWRTQLNRHNWLAMGLAIGASILVFLAFHRDR